MTDVANHRLTTHADLDKNYWAVCTCGWKGPTCSSGPEAARTFMDHEAEHHQAEEMSA